MSDKSSDRCGADDGSDGDGRSTGRRTVLKAAIGAGLTASLPELAGAAKPPHKMRPQPGDIVVFRFGDRKGEAIKPEDIVSGREIVQGVGMDPQTKTLRDGSRLNGLNLVRVDPESLDEETRPHAAGGIIAYSSVCTHQGCDLTQWLPENNTFKCYCHYSEFDVRHRGKPQHGPAKRRLAILPLEESEGILKVANKFVGKVGFKK